MGFHVGNLNLKYVPSGFEWVQITGSDVNCQYLIRFRGEIRVQRRGGGGRRRSVPEAPEGCFQIELERGAQEPRDDDGLRIHRHAASSALIAKLPRERGRA